MPRIHCPQPLAPGDVVALPEAAARHVQVLRLQPGDALTLFAGAGGEFEATVERMGRSEVWVRVAAWHANEREASRAICLAVGMPANERMDWLVEKACELGVASVVPLLTQRTVVRLQGERAQRRQAHWQAIAVGACEQCGRNRVPQIEAPVALADWLAAGTSSSGCKAVLSLAADSQPLASRLASPTQPLHALVGPEGGLTPAEEDAARQAGFQAVSLGARVLRTETAALALLVLAA